LARLTSTGSAAGEWLDHVVDAARLPLVHLAVAAHLYRANEPLWIVMGAVAFLVLSSVWFFAQTLAEKLSPPNAPGAVAPTWVSFLKLPYDPGFLYLAITLLAIRPAFVLVYLALFAVTAAVASMSLVRKYRSLAQLPPQPAATGRVVQP
jgi:phosphatidylglycerophosphate synthase